MVGTLRRPHFLVLAAVLAVTSCSSGDDSDTAASTIPTSVPFLTDEECVQASRDAVVPLQEFIDTYDHLTAEQWNALDPAPDVEAAQNEVVAIAQAAVDRGCDPVGMEERLASALDDIDGQGEVGRAIAAALRGDRPLLGPPMPVIETTVPRNQVPTTVTLRPGDSLPALLDRLAPGSTIEFAAGTHKFTEPILLDMDINFVGAGESETIISSTAEGVAVAFVGPGGFTMRDITIEHTGAAEASVFLAIEGPVTIANATVRGGVASADGSGGGHGIAFAYEDLPGFPERLESERLGALSIRSTTITDNDAAGVLVTGTAAPDLVDLSVTASGSCGVCYSGTSAGRLADSTIESNAIGLQAGGDSSPVVTGNRFRANSGVGVAISGNATPKVTATIVEENGDIGIQILDNAAPLIDRNTVRLHGVGLLVAGTARATISNNGVVDHEIGIQVGGDAVVESVSNTIWLSSIAAVSYGEKSSGAIRDNRIDRAAEVAIQTVGSSRTEVTDNVIENVGSVGISFADQATGNATGNRVSNRDVGVQVGGTANPDLIDNVIRNSVTVGILYGGGASGTASKNEVSSAEAVGVLAGGLSAPRFEENDITQNAVGMVFRESTRAVARRNVVDLNSIGVQVVDKADAAIEANMITNSLEAGAVFGGSASGTFEWNTMATNGNTTIQVGESANTRIAFNEIRGQGAYGVVYRDNATGEFRKNRIIDFIFGVQVNDAAQPQLYDNTLEEIALTNIAYAGSSGGEISGNRCATTLGAGISVTAPANPNLGNNACTVSRAG